MTIHFVTNDIIMCGHFALAIPGGSVLTMLAGSAPAWADKCTIAYVNHKAVPVRALRSALSLLSPCPVQAWILPPRIF